jgi:hypothetical protein
VISSNKLHFVNVNTKNNQNYVIYFVVIFLIALHIQIFLQKIILAIRLPVI